MKDIVTLGQLMKIPIRNGVFKGKEYLGSGVPLIKMGQLFASRFLSSDDPSCELIQLNSDELERFGLVKNDLVFSRTSVVPEGVGLCSLVTDTTKQLAFESNLIRVRLEPDLVNPEYVFRYFQSSIGRASVVGISNGVAVRTIRGSDLRNLELGLPERSTQNFVVVNLRAYDDLIEKNQRRIKLLEEAARLIYREWFVRLRFPGREITPTENGIPEGWHRIAVAQAIDFNPKETLPNGGIRFVPMGALSENGMTVDANLTEIRESGTTVKFRNGDTLLARITPCLENGKTAFVGFLNEGEVASGSTEFIVMRGAKVGPCFTYYLARSEDFRGIAVASMVGSSGRQRAQVSVIGEFSILLPPLNLLDDFESLVQPMFDQIWTLVGANERLTKARDLLLPRLMSGEIEV